MPLYIIAGDKYTLDEQGGRMGRSCPFPFPYNALGNPIQKLVRSLLLLAVIASRVTRRSSMPQSMAGAGLARRPLAPSGPGTVGCEVQSRCLYSHTYKTCPASGHSSPGLGSTGSLAHPLLSPTALRCPGCPRSVVRLYGGSLAPDYGPVGTPWGRSFRKPGLAGGFRSIIRTGRDGGHCAEAWA